MSTTQDIIFKLEKYFSNKSNVEKVMLFGSYARNTQTRRSDIDLILIVHTDKRFFDRYDEFNDIFDILPASCDMLIYTPQEWEQLCKRKFFRNILNQSKEIYVSRKQ